jgi:hypothetical protein
MHTLIAENLAYIKERSILQDRGHPAQTPGSPATDLLSLGWKLRGPRRQTFCRWGGNSPGFPATGFSGGLKNYWTDIRLAIVFFPQTPYRAFGRNQGRLPI